MKLFNKFFLLFAAASLLFVACNDEEKFTPGDPDLDGCYKVYFPQSQNVNLSLDPADPTELDIIVRRENTFGAITVPVEIDDEAGVFVVSEVAFESGVDSCVVHVTFDDTEVGVSYSCTINVTDPMYSSVYSDKVSSITISVVRERWISLGMAEYCDWWFFYNENEGTQMGGYMVELLQNESTPSKFRLVEPYKEGLENPDEGYGGPGTYQPESDDNTYMSFQIMSPGNTLGGNTVSQTGLIYFPDYDTGWVHPSYVDNVYILHPYRFTSTNVESSWLHNYVVSYQDDGTTPALVQLAPYYYMFSAGGWNYSQYDEMIWIIFPGVVLSDYSAEVEYLGRDDDYNVTASVTLGADVASARVAMVEGDGVSSAATAIQRGTVDYTEITDDGVVSFFCDEGGTYSIVAVTYDEDGVAQEYGYDTFKLSSPTETWTLYGVGDYEYSIYWYGTDPSLELYQSDDDETRFMITDWGYGVEFHFTWDQSTNEVVVEDQDTGATYGFYGSVYVDDMVDYLGTGGSFYDNGKFYFLVTYYCSGGEFGYGCETFTITGGDPFTLNDLLGTYIGVGISDFGPDYDETEEWTFEASDDETKGNFMMTVYNGWPCVEPIYGTFDTNTGGISIETGTGGVFFYGSTNYDYYFLSYYAYYYNGWYGTSVEMSLLPNGTFIGPLEGDLICELAYYAGTSSAAGWNQMFDVVYGTKVSSSPAALSVSAQTDSKVERTVSDREVNRKILKTSRIPYEKPATVTKAASVEQQASTKLDKSEMRSHKSVPVNIKVREN